MGILFDSDVLILHAVSLVSRIPCCRANTILTTRDGYNYFHEIISIQTTGFRTRVIAISLRTSFIESVVYPACFVRARHTAAQTIAAAVHNVSRVSVRFKRYVTVIPVHKTTRIPGNKTEYFYSVPPERYVRAARKRALRFGNRVADENDQNGRR